MTPVPPAALAALKAIFVHGPFYVHRSRPVWGFGRPRPSAVEELSLTSRSFQRLSNAGYVAFIVHDGVCPIWGLSARGLRLLQAEDPQIAAIDPRLLRRWFDTRPCVAPPDRAGPERQQSAHEASAVMPFVFLPVGKPAENAGIADARTAARHALKRLNQRETNVMRAGELANVVLEIVEAYLAEARGAISASAAIYFTEAGVPKITVRFQRRSFDAICPEADEQALTQIISEFAADVIVESDAGCSVYLGLKLRRRKRDGRVTTGRLPVDFSSAALARQLRRAVDDARVAALVRPHELTCTFRQKRKCGRWTRRLGLVRFGWDGYRRQRLGGTGTLRAIKAVDETCKQFFEKTPIEAPLVDFLTLYLTWGASTSSAALSNDPELADQCASQDLTSGAPDKAAG